MKYKMYLAVSRKISIYLMIYTFIQILQIYFLFSLYDADDEKHQKNKCSKYASFLETVTITDGRHIFIKVNCKSKKENIRSSLWCGGDV